MGKLFDLIEEHRDRHRPYEPSYSQVAEQVDVSKQTLLNWRAPVKLPTAEHLASLARITGVPYLRVLDAALHDAGYLPEPASKPRVRRGKGRGGQVSRGGGGPRRGEGSGDQ